MIQYADDQALGIEQRRALAPLNPLRGEINGLVDGWRNSARSKDKCRARLFDRRTADALTAALQGDKVHGEELLKAVKADVIEERVSIGRVEYLRYAVLAALGVFALFGAVAVWGGAGWPLANFVRSDDIWLAAGVGSLGALFSIAIGIRSREIRTDLQRRDNIADAILRVGIGAVSAIILFSLVRSRFIEISGLAIDGADGVATHAAIIVAFLAGFSERLVGNFLTRAADGVAGAAVGGAAGMTSAAAQAAAQTEVEATETNPRGKLEVEMRAAAGSPQAAAGGGGGGDRAGHDHDHDHDESADGCVCDITVADEEVTDDAELPEATGGVERVAA